VRYHALYGNKKHQISHIQVMNIQELDLRLLHVLDAVYRQRSISRAAHEMGMSQPAVSHAIARLRRALGNALFERTHDGVRPTPLAHELAQATQQALQLLETALHQTQGFEPLQTRQCFRVHLSDIGEARFLPQLMRAMRSRASHAQLQTRPVPVHEVADALDRGLVDVAIGFLPGISSTQQSVLLHDHYGILLRSDHPLLHTCASNAPLPLPLLQQLEFVLVRSHAQTLRILQDMQLEDRIRLTAAHFLAVPAIVSYTDLAVIMPMEVAQSFVDRGGWVAKDAALPDKHFAVSMHWSRRFAQDPAGVWLRGLIQELFEQGEC